MANRIQQYFEPSDEGVRKRDYLREFVKQGGLRPGIKQANTDVLQALTRFGISALEAPQAMRTGQASGQWYDTPIGRLNSVQSEAQNRMNRGDSLAMSIANPAMDTILGAGDLAGVAGMAGRALRPLAGMAKGVNLPGFIRNPGYFIDEMGSPRLKKSELYRLFKEKALGAPGSGYNPREESFIGRELGTRSGADALTNESPIASISFPGSEGLQVSPEQLRIKRLNEMMQQYRTGRKEPTSLPNKFFPPKEGYVPDITTKGDNIKPFRVENATEDQMAKIRQAGYEWSWDSKSWVPVRPGRLSSNFDSNGKPITMGYGDMQSMQAPGLGSAVEPNVEQPAQEALRAIQEGKKYFRRSGEQMPMNARPFNQDIGDLEQTLIDAGYRTDRLRVKPEGGPGSTAKLYDFWKLKDKKANRKFLEDPKFRFTKGEDAPELPEFDPSNTITTRNTEGNLINRPSFQAVEDSQYGQFDGLLPESYGQDITDTYSRSYQSNRPSFYADKGKEFYKDTRADIAKGKVDKWGTKLKPKAPAPKQFSNQDYLDDIEKLAKKYGDDPKYAAYKGPHHIDDRFYARIADDHFNELDEQTRRWLEFEAPAMDFESPDVPNYKGFANADPNSSGTTNVHGGQITSLRDTVDFERQDAIDYAERIAEDTTNGSRPYVGEENRKHWPSGWGRYNDKALTASSEPSLRSRLRYDSSMYPLTNSQMDSLREAGALKNLVSSSGLNDSTPYSVIDKWVAEQTTPPVKLPAKPAGIKIISGGQTGADRGALLGAKAAGIPTGGTVPKGWRTDTGSDPSLKSFGLTEHNSSSYVPRTIDNINNSDATVAFLWGDSVGTRKTIGYARTGKWGYDVDATKIDGHKPVLVINTKNLREAVDQVKAFMAKTGAKTLNVAGHRESSQGGIQEFVKDVIENSLKK